MNKVTTGCCALCQLNDINNETKYEELEFALDILKRQMKDNKEVGVTTGNGQTAVFSIVSPGEYILEKNLIKLGFEEKHIFKRRVGYPETGDLKMFIKNL